MKFTFTKSILALLILMLFAHLGFSQSVVKGKIIDAASGEALIGATVVLKGTTTGGLTDLDGIFEFKVNKSYPFTLTISSIGYSTLDVEVTNDKSLNIKMSENALLIDEFVTTARREVTKATPTPEYTFDKLAIRNTAALSAYEGTSNAPEVDVTRSSALNTTINTRGFNSTSPVRSLQIIDGVDNQAPGLNFSLGNFLGSSELDLLKLTIVSGASSAYYGPNAFNGVIKMETQNPFNSRGLSALVKGGERNLVETAIRYADVIKRKKDSLPFIGVKFNFYHIRVYDWEAQNYKAVDGTKSKTGNPGGWDKVNSYGDEYDAGFDYANVWQFPDYAGLGTFHRKGYNEVDLVDYNSKNTKANAAFHFRLNPSKKDSSAEFIVSSSFGTGTTVLQGDNRFSLRDILFFQNRLELRKTNKYFIRAYATNEDAGNSFDPYFTALLLLQKQRTNESWKNEYERYWRGDFKTGRPSVYDEMVAKGYPTNAFGDSAKARLWLAENADFLTKRHEDAANASNTRNTTAGVAKPYLIPGTQEFKDSFNLIVNNKTNIRTGDFAGTGLYDKSALYHITGQFRFTPTWVDEITIGGNGRLYAPKSNGTIFSDSGRTITNYEFGMYSGFEKSFNDGKWKWTTTARLDKNENYPFLFSPAMSLTYQRNSVDFIRVSINSAIRNPTLGDQYLQLNVGRAILAGNLTGQQDLITVESFIDYLNNGRRKNILKYFSLDPIRPEKVKSIEVGFQQRIFENVEKSGKVVSALDAVGGAYFSVYDDFIGYKLGVRSGFDPVFALPINVQAYRYATNSKNTVTTNGASIALTYLYRKVQFSGNYSWNKLRSAVNDSIIPAYNTPEHKYNLSISARSLPITIGSFKYDKFGFGINYKFIEGFRFEGSPQFTGDILSYNLLDVQLSFGFKKINSTLKIGAANALNNLHYETYGGPLLGRMAYASWLYDFTRAD
jgi:iron complex outermembrane recepter protein